MVDSSNRPRVESQLEAEMEWFRDISIRPPLRENATIALERTIKQSLDYNQRGVFTDTETAGRIADAFDRVRYPTVRRYWI